MTLEPRRLSTESTTVPEPLGDRLSRQIFAVLALGTTLVLLTWVVFYIVTSLSYVADVPR
ncbi:MAG: hypothetical protein ACR2JI_05995 [Mycobacterium sp.]